MAKSSRDHTRTPAPSSGLDALETVEVKAGVFKNTCLDLMNDVSAHPRQYVITKHGRPVAKLVPPDQVISSAFGFLRGTVVEQGALVEPDFESWSDLA